MTCVTQWFPYIAIPAHSGVYERQTNMGRPYYAYFDGEKWYYGGTSVEQAEMLYFDGAPVSQANLPWRGIADKPT